MIQGTGGWMWETNPLSMTIDGINSLPLLFYVKHSVITLFFKMLIFVFLQLALMFLYLCVFIMCVSFCFGFFCCISVISYS